MFKTISALNNFVRTVLSLGILGVVSVVGWMGYQTFSVHDLRLKEKDREIAAKQAQIDELGQEVQAKQQEIERLNTVLRLLKVDHRVAQIEVLDQTPAEDGKRVMTKFRFAEVDERGYPIGEPQTLTITGDVAYIDAWVVKFMDEHIEQADALRSTSVCIFRRVFGEFQEPKDGFVLDPVGSRPAAYSHGSEMSDFERAIWSKFWDYANDPAKAAKAGVRAAHGEAPSIKLVRGKVYRVELRASGGLSIVPADVPSTTRRDAVQ